MKFIAGESSEYNICRLNVINITLVPFFSVSRKYYIVYTRVILILLQKDQVGWYEIAVETYLDYICVIPLHLTIFITFSMYLFCSHCLPYNLLRKILGGAYQSVNVWSSSMCCNNSVTISEWLSLGKLAYYWTIICYMYEGSKLI